MSTLLNGFELVENILFELPFWTSPPASLQVQYPRSSNNKEVPCLFRTVASRLPVIDWSGQSMLPQSTPNLNKVFLGNFKEKWGEKLENGIELSTLVRLVGYPNYHAFNFSPHFLFKYITFLSTILKCYLVYKHVIFSLWLMLHSTRMSFCMLLFFFNIYFTEFDLWLFSQLWLLPSEIDWDKKKIMVEHISNHMATSWNKLSSATCSGVTHVTFWRTSQKCVVFFAK